MYGFIRPTRPIASCTVAEPNGASRSTAARSARAILRLTTPISYISFPPCLERGVEPRKHPPRIAFVDLVPVVADDDRRRLDVALGVVVVMTGLRVDAAHSTDHLAREQDVVDRDHLREQVDARLVIDAGVEEDVLQDVILQERLLQLLGEAAKAPPVIGNGAAAVRNDEAKRREILEQVAGHAL